MDSRSRRNLERIQTLRKLYRSKLEHQQATQNLRRKRSRREKVTDRPIGGPIYYPLPVNAKNEKNRCEKSATHKSKKAVFSLLRWLALRCPSAINKENMRRGLSSKRIHPPLKEAKAALLKRGIRLDESGGSDTDDDDFDFNTEDEEIELELEIEAVEAEADADDADQNEEESESSADEESDGDDNDEIEFEEGFIDDDEDDSEEDDLIDDELENSEAASNFTSLGSDHGDSDAVIDEIEKYNFLYVFFTCILCRRLTRELIACSTLWGL
ncbi:unnamed protein product [Oikopleura dioica]|uniref:Uncharacterized protein n=1 Tax=Oikopleura dioica TaxID=34765 RepID=E4X126_OIKDI|nr:unnamed protein product [Oikopleura dioica]